MNSKSPMGEDCPLTRYLKEVSMYGSCDLKAQSAGALLYGLDYPRFTPQPPDLASIALLLASIAAEGQTDLLSEARETCLSCPQLPHCRVGTLLEASKSDVMVNNNRTPV